MNFLKHICDMLVMSNEELTNFSRTMPHRYKKYTVKKRSGNGYRVIAQPSSEAKFIQRILLDELRKILPVHSCAMAYEPGVGIKLNATHHKDSCFLLKMDFKDFFPSITPYLFFSITEKLGFKFDDINRRLIENIIFWKSTRDSNLKLSIGAPTSPFISNFVLYEFDRHMAEFCLLRKIIYTRYADDLTFTCNEKGTLFEIPSIVEKQLKHHCFGKIKINKKKTVFSSKAFNRHVTGIVITNDNQLSIGRDRKRELSSMIHKFSLGKLDETESSRLKGLLSYAHHIEPIFINRMKRKYGPDIVNQIFSYICS